MTRSILLAFGFALATLAHAAPAGPQFTYQGELRTAGVPANGAFDMQFLLYLQAEDDVPGAVASNTLSGVPVSGGLFSVELDFTDAPFLLGEEYWLEVRVRVADSGGGYTQLLPRQKVTPTPYAIASLSVREGGVTREALAPGSVGSAQVEDGAITPAKLSFTPGTVTAITAGAGLTGGTITGSGTLAVDSTVVQARVTGSCPVGEYFRGIAANGSVTCEPVPGVPRITEVDSSGSVGTWPSIAIGTDGHPVIAYRDETNTALKVASCANSACTQSILTTVDPGGNVGEFTSIAIGNDGLPVIAYYDRSNGNLKVAKCANPACTGSATLSTVDSTANVGQYTAIAVPTDGLPLIAYRDVTNTGLKLARCANPACTGSATLRTLDATGNKGEFNAIAIAPDGFAFISYVDVGQSRIRSAECHNLDCSNFETREIDGTASVGHQTSVAFTSFGEPLISYRNNTDGRIRVAVCATASPMCSGFIVRTNTDNTGFFASMAMGQDQIPVIASSGGLGGVRLTRCSDPVCSLSQTAPVDAQNTRTHPRLAIGHDHLPVIVYTDTTSQNLYVVKCGTRTCQ
ncbi:MAG TPA: hypothetical protein PKZ76_14215 [Xanthomonadaceae bacterium]|nr:hypothetical protein [Xanthomonadaceae bacterium]